MIAHLHSEKRRDVVTEADSAIEGVLVERWIADWSDSQRVEFIMDVINIDHGRNPRRQTKLGLQTTPKRGAALGRRDVWFFQAVSVGPTE